MTEFWPSIGIWDARAAASSASEASGEARKARFTAAELETRLDRALLACEAMWSLLREKLHVTDVDLAQRINEIDLSDGQLDGKVRRGAVSCPKCGRAIARRFPKCMYCGQAVVQEPFSA